MKKTKQQQRRSKTNIHPRGKRVAGNTARKALSTLFEAFGSLDKWKSRWPDFEEDETLRVSREKTSEIIADLLARLEDNYPFHHPGYAGQ
ncbi:MAG TPA: hypothetical protein VI758_11795, partial [Bacteroidota bacterium]